MANKISRSFLFLITISFMIQVILYFKPYLFFTSYVFPEKLNKGNNLVRILPEQDSTRFVRIDCDFCTSAGVKEVRGTRKDIIGFIPSDTTAYYWLCKAGENRMIYKTGSDHHQCHYIKGVVNLTDSKSILDCFYQLRKLIGPEESKHLKQQLAPVVIESYSIGEILFLFGITLFFLIFIPVLICFSAIFNADLQGPRNQVKLRHYVNDLILSRTFILMLCVFIFLNYFTYQKLQELRAPQNQNFAGLYGDMDQIIEYGDISGKLNRLKLSHEQCMRLNLKKKVDDVKLYEAINKATGVKAYVVIVHIGKKKRTYKMDKAEYARLLMLHLETREACLEVDSSFRKLIDDQIKPQVVFPVLAEKRVYKISKNRQILADYERKNVAQEINASVMFISDCAKKKRYWVFDHELYFEYDMDKIN